MTQQTSFEQRTIWEGRIRTALLLLDPDGELEGTVLGRYSPWQEVREVPAEHIARLCKDLETEAEFRKALGDEVYFANLGRDEKIELWHRALDLVPEKLAEMEHGPHAATLFAVFRRALVRCLPLAGVTPHTPLLFPAPNREPEPPPNKTPGRKPGRGNKAFVKPTVEEVRAYAEEASLAFVNAQEFWDQYEANGWKVGGRAAMKDWKAAVRQWNRRQPQFAGGRGKLENYGPNRQGKDAGADPLSAANNATYKPMKKGANA
ncbi:hypothetical protein LJB76_03115 [Clostridia bacterium OttesenSCG-928-O13]|nr:hypothetical protein [Clostridia bacterium OttesenSCG-928-O13]